MNIRPLVGADPEVFARVGGKIVSAHGMIPGDKKNPFKVNRGAVQVDGMALEFNIEPAWEREEFRLNIDEVMQQLREMSGAELVAEPVADFGLEYIASQPDEARDLGCDPDYNGWTGQENVKPDVLLPFRTGSGHVHVGWDEYANEDPNHRTMCCALARHFDFYLALPSLLFDKEVRRREMYGKAGAFRPKQYGFEYRVLSNKWLTSPDLIDWVYDNTQLAFQTFFSNPLDAKYGDIQGVINQSRVDDALTIIKAEGIPVPVAI